MDCKNCSNDIIYRVDWYNEPELLCPVCYKEYEAWMDGADYFQEVAEDQSRQSTGSRSKDYPYKYYDYGTDDQNNLEYVQDLADIFKDTI